MEKSPLAIEGALLLRPKVFSDERGIFIETWNRQTFEMIGLDVEFLQDNYSRSLRGVLRGLHYQIGCAVQGKLAWVTSGEVYDVIVDLRSSSPTFGRWLGQRLNAQTHERLWIPPGCAHGFLVTSAAADFHYKCTNIYSAQHERSLAWNDPDLAIAWPLPAGYLPLISQRDREATTFAECETFS